MTLPSFLTFTGLDDRTDLDRVKALSDQYPIEWGILFGGRLGGNRYPANWQRLVNHDPSLRLSAHLCGTYARSLHLPDPRFNRVQVNAIDYDLESLTDFQQKIGKPVIIQVRRQTFPILPYPDSIFSLFDQSGGKGKSPVAWPVQEAGMPLVGYAGGIGPHNVMSTLQAIDATVYWIDMETHIRTNDWLDLDKCEEICKALFGRIKVMTKVDQPDSANDQNHRNGKQIIA